MKPPFQKDREIRKYPNHGNFGRDKASTAGREE